MLICISSAPSLTESVKTVSDSIKINPVLARQTDFDCHQCGISCHSWAKLEKHLQWHEETDHSVVSSQGQSQADHDSPLERASIISPTPTSINKKNLANLSESQLKMLKQSLGKMEEKTDRMEMSDGEGKMSEGEN